LDQFSRNIYRDLPQSFAQDGMALTLSQIAVRDHMIENMTGDQLAFLLMPFMHSESKKIHEEAVIYFNVTGLEGTLEFEKKHKKIIDKFGRYPHRNHILGRKSTEEELAFLKLPGSSF
ncbi:DUF924 domain-containing protein, partial [Bacteriovoracaceae bacterium]|nr:DUF924 domain-containing protein [Bacteriovoracaceae bacterium]